MQKQIERVEEFLKNNDWAQNDAEFECVMEETTNSFEKEQIGIEAVTPILELMERHPLVSFGFPGSLVHFMEKFYKKGYEELLEKSVQKTPTVHTVWLLNRLLNGAAGEKAKEYLQLMESISSNDNLDEKIRNTAKAFLDHQKSL